MSRSIADKAKEYIMNRFTSVLAIVILAFGAWSCKKEESPSQYDANVDAPSTIATVPADSGILKDQRKISAAASIEGISSTPSSPTTPTPGHPASTSAPSTPTSTPSTPGTSTPTTPPATTPTTPTTPAAGAGKKPSAKAISEITDLIAKIKQATTANPNDIPAQYMTDECVAAVKPIMTGTKDLTPKMAKLKELIKAKGIEIPASMETNFKLSGGPTDDLTKSDLSKSTWEETADGVYVINGKDKNLFVNTPTGWKFGIPTEMKPILPLIAEMMTAQDKFTTTLTSGLTDGSITKANFQAKSDQITKETLAPAAAKMMKFIMDNAGKSAP